MAYISLVIVLLIPYPDQPDWESNDYDFSTGGALVDIDLDGDVDFVTGNGNDMSRDPNRVYYNTGSALETTASWSSADSGYNAHISVGDINYDGYPDLAVANYGDPYALQYDKFYYNDSGTFASTTSWRPHDQDNSFACAFGDMDGDGDLDLATACGESYGNTAQRAKVYLNNNGILDTLPVWQSNIQSYFYDVVWVDIDSDGDLDLALAAEYAPNIIYRNTGGILESSPYWQSANSMGTLKIGFGDVDNDNDLDMVCANNAQLGGTSNCELYLNTGTILETTPAWTSLPRQYYSCVALGDVDRDGDLDLAAGGWWEPISVFENSGGTFPQSPSWSWSPPNPYDLVCENISFGDVDNTYYINVTNEVHVVNPDKRVFYCDHRWVANITRVRRASGDLARNEYCFSYIDGWVSLKDIIAQEETVWVDYTAPIDLDLIVTNWEAGRGNFLFLNTTGAIAEASQTTRTGTFHFPNPNNGRFTIVSDVADISVTIYDSAGRLVCQQNGSNIRIDNAGIYFIHIFHQGKLIAAQKLIVVR